MRVAILFFCLLVFSCLNAQDANFNSENVELTTIRLEEAGFKKDSIDNILRQILETPHKDLRGLVVIKDGHIVIEEYFNTFWRF